MRRRCTPTPGCIHYHRCIARSCDVRRKRRWRSSSCHSCNRARTRSWQCSIARSDNDRYRASNRRTCRHPNRIHSRIQSTLRGRRPRRLLRLQRLSRRSRPSLLCQERRHGYPGRRRCPCRPPQLAGRRRRQRPPLSGFFEEQAAPTNSAPQNTTRVARLLSINDTPKQDRHQRCSKVKSRIGCRCSR